MTFNEDIIERATLNTHFRDVLSTGLHSQVVVMRIPSGGEIGEETHQEVDGSWFSRPAKARRS